MNTIKTPIGLKAGVEAVQEICSKAGNYRCGLKLPHFIVNIDAGNGQTTFTEYMTEAFNKYHVRHFGGLDNYLEYKLDGSMQQLAEIFGRKNGIPGCAVYTNEYEGVVAMDISGLADVSNEEQAKVFIREVLRLAEYATFIFYIPSAVNRQMENFVNKLVREMKTHAMQIRILKMKPYTSAEMVQMIRQMTDDAGIALAQCPETENLLLKTVVDNDIHTVKAAESLCQLFISAASFDSFMPRLTKETLKNICLRVESMKRGAK